MSKVYDQIGMMIVKQVYAHIYSRSRIAWKIQSEVTWKLIFNSTKLLGKFTGNFIFQL